MADHDIVIAGGGHNGLACAPLLALNGLKVCVLERNPWVGGGVVTRELTLPGFRHDPFGSSHVWIHLNPDFRAVMPELEKHGLKYMWSEDHITGHPLGYQWRQNGAPLFGRTESSLTLTNVSSSDEGAYTVVVSNSIGSVTSAPAHLVTYPLLIAAQPVSLTVTQSQAASFSVSASGLPPFTYQWQKEAGGTWTNVPYATNRILAFASAQTADAGTYHVIVSNSLASETSQPATLTVIIPPTITTQPASQTNVAGTTVTFAVAASGTAPLHYQWKKAGLDVLNATNAACTSAAGRAGQSLAALRG